MRFSKMLLFDNYPDITWGIFIFLFLVFLFKYDILALNVVISRSFKKNAYLMS